jgi:hypothetical protein
LERVAAEGRRRSESSDERRETGMSVSGSGDDGEEGNLESHDRNLRSAFQVLKLNLDFDSSLEFQDPSVHFGRCGGMRSYSFPSNLKMAFKE